MVASVIYQKTVLVTLWRAVFSYSLVSRHIRSRHDVLGETGKTVSMFCQSEVTPHYLKKLHSAF